MATAPAPGTGEPAGSELERLLEEWFRRVEAGETPDLRALAGDRPDLIPALAELLEREDGVLSALAALAHDPPAAGLPFERLGRYRVLRLLGEGSMGQVYLAEDEPLRRAVALKVLHPRLLGDPRRRLRFEREARITAALDHDNIVPVYDVGTDGPIAYMAIKFIPGQSLEQVPKPLPPREVARIGARLARALHAAHELGVIHRDVKPANVLFDGTEPVLVDFGLARSLAEVTATQEGTVAGTLLYMSPEQLRGETVTLDGRTDVYSLGATLYEAAAGKAAFDSGTTESVIRQVMEVDPPRLQLSGADRDLDTILRRALEKERGRRFPTALEFAEELERFLDGVPIRSRRSSTIHRAARLARRRPRTTLAIAVLTLAAATASLLYASERRTASQTFERRVAVVRGDVDAGRLDSARRGLAELAAGASDSAAVADVERALAARAALADFVDRLQERFYYDSRERVRALAARLAASGGDRAAIPLGDLALCCAALHLGDRDAALFRAAAVDEACGASRAAAVARAVALGEPLDRTLRSAPAGRSADDCLFAALALELEGSQPLEARLAEVRTALALDPVHGRARFELATLLRERGEYRAALEAFRGVVDEGRHRGVVLRNLATTSLLLGDRGAARGYLDRILPAEQTADVAAVEFDYAVRGGDHAGAERVLDAARARFPGEPQLALAVAHACELRGAWADARATLADLANRDLGRVLLFQAELIAARVDFLDVASPQRDLEEIRSRAVDLARRAPTPYLAAAAHRLDAWILATLGRREDALDATARVLEIEPSLVPAVKEFVSTLALLHPSSQRYGWFLADAVRHADRVLGEPDLLQQLPPVHRDELLAARALLALRTGDAPVSARLIARYQADAAESEQKERTLAVLRGQLELLEAAAEDRDG